MKAMELQMKLIAPKVLSIHCPDRYVLRRLLEYFDHIPAVAAHSKILAGPAVWFRTETEADLHKIRESIAGLAFPLLAAEAAARPPLFVRHFWLVWAALVGTVDVCDAVMQIINGTGDAIYPYITGFIVILLSLYNYKHIQDETEDRIRSVHEMFLEAMKDKTKE